MQQKATLVGSVVNAWLKRFKNWLEKYRYWSITAAAFDPKFAWY